MYLCRRRTLFQLLVLAPALVLSFVQSPAPARRNSRTFLLGETTRTVSLETELNDEKTAALFAWVSRAFAGDPEYNDLYLAIVTIFGDLPEDSEPKKMARKALELAPKDEEETVGDCISLEDREMSSLSAMGAGQWTGQWKTRPHSLLDVTNFTSVDDWVKTLPRGVKRTLKRANAQNYTVTSKQIQGGKPAPHSSLAHFRCVLEHEVRLLAGYDPSSFFGALDAAIGRYIGTTRMTGEIQEYRLNGTVIAFAHEVHKGKTIRGQWFYATDEASKNYVWFHSVQELVRRGIEADDVTVVDLGPSGSDSFTELKERYGFKSVDEWTEVADYFGPFVYKEKQSQEGMGQKLKAMEEVARIRRRFLF